MSDRDDELKLEHLDAIITLVRDAPYSPVLREAAGILARMRNRIGRPHAMEPMARHFAKTASYGEQLAESTWLIKVGADDRAAFPVLGDAVYVLYVEHGWGSGYSALVDTEADAETLRTQYQATARK